GPLLHVRDGEEVRAAEVDFVAGGEFLLPFEAVAVEAGAVEAVEVAHAPAATGVVDLGVFAAAQFVLEDDAVGGGAPEVIALSDREGEYVSEAVVPPDYQINRRARRHGVTP